MAVPTSRSEFKQYCLRKLGKPVIEINVDDDQVDDRIDEALKFYWDYHYDGQEKIYYKHRVSKRDKPGSVSDVLVINGGTGYSNNDTVIFTPVGPTGNGATAQVVTDSSGSITSIDITEPGDLYHEVPNITINTTTGSGATFKVYNGGYINIPENIIGVVHVFPIGDPAVRSDDLFNIRYQIALNDLYTLTSVSMVPFFMTMQHLSLIQEILVGKQPLRYSRHRNKLFIDMDWNKFNDDEFILVEAYKIIDPDIYTDAWGDRWLARYASALIKKQWGTNMKKFGNMQLPGGIVMNGQQIYDEADEEINNLERDMVFNISLPAADMIG
jgi:hypothetical protein